ncbi:MAG TPA: AAA family ATPase, partial [Bacillota bacterium]|nr:AAA family ATPase [Bacillota bacterium]
MSKVIAVFNQKGGVGKTTTNVNLSACIAVKGRKVLVVDIDPQGNTTSGLGIDKKGLKKTIYDVLIGEARAEEVITQTAVENLSIIPSSVQLAGAEIELTGFE